MFDNEQQMSRFHPGTRLREPHSYSNLFKAIQGYHFCSKPKVG